MKTNRCQTLRRRKTAKQHISPCSDCPFARKSLNGWLGGASVEQWLDIARGDGDGICHTTDKICAGLAIFRANTAKLPRYPATLKLPPNRVDVFATPMEFAAHHKLSAPAPHNQIGDYK